MRRAIVHIGTPRTGTSTFQTLLHTHRDGLAEAGVLYPDLTPRSAPSPHLSHQHLGETLDGRRPRRERDELLARLDEALAGTEADTALISYEGLCGLPPRHRGPDELRDLFARRGFAMEILMTVRPQATYAHSQYTWRAQFLRERRAFAPAFARDLRDPRLDYPARLEGWARAAGGRVRAVPVQDRRAGGPLVARIAAETGLTDRLMPLLDASDLDRTENRSLGPVAVEVSRRLRMGGVATRDQGQARAITDLIDRAARERGLDGAPFQALDAAAAARAAERFAAANDRFARAVWGEDWAGRVADARLAPVNEIAAAPADPATEAQVATILAETRARFGLPATGGFGARARMLALGAWDQARRRLRTIGG